jgi:hypothetical protein
MGFAPTVETALRFDTEETADAMMRNGYGASFAEIGSVIELG